MSLPDRPRKGPNNHGGFARGKGIHKDKRAGGDRTDLPADSTHGCALADERAATQSDEQVALAKSMYLALMKHPFMGIDDRLGTLVRGGISPRDAFVLTAMARGATQGEIAKATGLSTVQHILDKFRDQLECLRMEVQMDALVDYGPKVMKAQAEVAQEKAHDQFAAAGRNVLGVLFPNRGAPAAQVNIAGRDIVTGGAVLNADMRQELKDVLALPIDAVKEEIRVIDAQFERPKPPGGEA